MRGRIIALDGLRGVAALGVLAVHTVAVFRGRTPPGHYHLAVDFFFLLSGFVVAYAYEDRLRAGLPLRTFARRRFERLYPLLALGVTLGMAFVTIRDWRHAAVAAPASLALSAYFVGLTTFPFPEVRALGQGLWPYDPPMWSLFFEFVANAAFACFATRLATRWLALWVCAAAAGLVVAGLGYGRLNLGPDAETVVGGLARVAFSFPAGVLLFRLWRGQRTPRLKAAPILLASILAAILITPMNQLDPWIELAPVMVAFPLIVLSGADAEAPQGLLRGMATVAGDLSYPLYILHMPVLFTVRGVLPPLDGPAKAVAAALAAATALGVAWAALKAYDEPIRRALARGPSERLVAGEPNTGQDKTEGDRNVGGVRS
jgi:peptidoglycan/LPS O-acetylase OafA/YrhL